MTGDDNLEPTLNDVRKAYRLIWLYQSRVMDIIRIIRDDFDYKFYGWISYPTKLGSSGVDPLDRPVWSMLPFYNIVLLHLPPGVDPNHPKRGEWMLELYIEADDSFFQRLRGESDPIPTELPPTEQSGTYLSMRALYCTEDVDLNWYYKMWCEFPKQEGVIEEHSDPPVKSIWKRFEMSTLGDKEAVSRAVGEFKKMLTDKLELQFTEPP
jgi:hypothetical protein